MGFQFLSFLVKSVLQSFLTPYFKRTNCLHLGHPGFVFYISVVAFLDFFLFVLSVILKDMNLFRHNAVEQAVDSRFRTSSRMALQYYISFSITA